MHRCVSALAVREALVGVPEGGFAIVLTDRPVDDLGDSLVARFRRQRVEPLDSWTTVPGHVRRHAPGRGAAAFDAVASRSCCSSGCRRAGTRRARPSRSPAITSWAAVTEVVLGVPAADVGLGSLVDRLGDLGVRQAWAGLSEEARESIGDWVGERAGTAAAAVLDLAASPTTAHVHVLALGLMLDVLYGDAGCGPATWSRPDAAGRPAIDCRGSARRRPARSGPRRVVACGCWPTPTLARPPRRVARHPGGVRDRRVPDRDRAVAEPPARATAPAWPTWPAPWSTPCPGDPGPTCGRGRRRAGVGGVPAARPRPGLVGPRGRHRARRHGRRLVRWLATEPSAPQRHTRPWEPHPPRRHGGAGRSGGCPTGWAVPRTWARRCAGRSQWTGGSIGPWPMCGRAAPMRRSPPPTATCARWCWPRGVSTTGSSPSSLADVTSRDVLPAGLLPVERVLVDVVEPLTRVAPVLLIVIDGMSAAVAAAVGDGISRLSWVEHVLAGGHGRGRPGRRARPCWRPFRR